MSASDLQPVHSSQTECDGSTALTEKFQDSVDWKEFKERTMAQVMRCHAGRMPPDYFMADLIVSFWMNHYDKTPEEIEEILRSTPLPPREESDEGLISVIDTSNEYQQTLESAPSLPLPATKSYKDALLTNLDGESGAVSGSSEEA